MLIIRMILSGAFGVALSQMFLHSGDSDPQHAIIAGGIAMALLFFYTIFLVIDETY